MSLWGEVVRLCGRQGAWTRAVEGQLRAKRWQSGAVEVAAARGAARSRPENGPDGVPGRTGSLTMSLSPETLVLICTSFPPVYMLLLGG